MTKNRREWLDRERCIYNVFVGCVTGARDDFMILILYIYIHNNLLYTCMYLFPDSIQDSIDMHVT